jgi:predicted S18 family serine protease
MALTNAEKQARWRERRNTLAKQAEQMIDTAGKLVEARKEIRRLKKRIAELEAALEAGTLHAASRSDAVSAAGSRQHPGPAPASPGG